MFNKLYVRIWLAVVLAVLVLTLLVGWVWRLAAEPPLRDLEVRNEAGQLIGRGRPRQMMEPGGWRHSPDLRDMMHRYAPWRAGPGAPAEPDGPGANPGLPPDRAQTTASNVAAFLAELEHLDATGRLPSSPEFVVRMRDGQVMRMHLLRGPPSVWSRPPFGFAWMLVWVAIAVALATYPIVRKLTRRLERLQDGVQQWGQGDLSARVPEGGEDEVGFLAKRFNQAAERVETLVKSHEALLASQRSLLANASHELRSPLTRIRMGLELLGPSTSPAFSQEISRNIAELDMLIEEILLASRLDSQQVDLGTVESVDLIGLAAEEAARVGAELDVHLQGEDAGDGDLDSSGLKGKELAVQGVAKLLRRAVRNLLENARRHGAGEVVLTLKRLPHRAQIAVSDRGPGVPEALRQRIFEPFYRLPGAAERDGGVGLGLALVKSIALRHGGQAFCEAREGGGARFVIELPLS
jgi:signal transduction histidine kinase